MAVLQGKVAIITGASSGIGYATAKRFAREGAKLVLGARRGAILASMVDEIITQGGEAVYLAGDVTDEVYASDLVALAVEQYGGLDIAFNNAGINGELGVDSDALSRAEWENTLTTNLTSAFLAAKYQLPQMLKRGTGSIIFTSSFVGYTIGFPQTAAYAASKAGMIGLTQALAVEYGARGIRVNALLPGGTDTPMGREFANTPEAMAFVKNLHALKRLADPAEIAQSALYLASDAASFTTGIALLVDGGVSICKT
ncbi:SDR family oxidoreductase [Shewanella xiamenensis]|uniref:SDR family oxidoreductase n=1 Tax=Shewanella xiamenensis TaxID=332186 RepID=UPI00166C6B7E|nr:SDR family oxidoreductase [Shewanella xiamenensis]MCL1069870.1 SDR family oxidoreductase [Shewanella xiamenensis]GGM88942.1 short-chain dehydrogenase [Shewanella xiamenensis]